jgi:hypothetical protein
MSSVNIEMYLFSDVQSQGEWCTDRMYYTHERVTTGRPYIPVFVPCLCRRIFYAIE